MKDKVLSQFRMRAAALAVTSCLSLAPWTVEAAGLGRITVLSNLGQPLRAEVEVSASRDELSGMTARLAPQEAFKQASIDYAPGLLDLRFAVEKRPDGNSIIRVTSNKPVNEPFLDFLVELNWPAGRLVREYTFLLDPPEVAAKSAGTAITMTDAKPVGNVAGGMAGEAAPSAHPAGRGQPAASEAKPRIKAKASEEAKSTAADTHRVKPGETLHKIASETRYEGVSLEQMLVGLYRANSDAFIGANINRLKAGTILSIPDQDTVAAIPQAEARKEYRAQSADWNAYRKKLAAAAAQGPGKEEGGSQSAGGKITAKVEDKTEPSQASKDQVKVSRTEAAGKTGAAAREEEAVAKDKALKEANERLVLLEKNVADLQKLLEMKNQSLAELQKQAGAKKPEEAKPPVVAAKPVEPPKPAEEPKPAEAPKTAEAPKPAEAAKPVEPPKTEETPKSAAAPKPPALHKPAPPPPEEPSFFDDMTLPLAGGGAILALLAGYFFYKRRRSGQTSAGMPASMPHPSSLGPNSVFRATGGQSVDTGNTTTPQATDFSQTGPGTIDTDEVDPVAEADVYMAYGRDAQAEEILLEALQKDPQRTAIHAKLLEIYANRKSLKQFETLAGELYAQTGGAGPEWEKVAAMGTRLDPANPLYSGGKAAVVQAFDPDATMIVSPRDMAEAAAAAVPEAAPALAVDTPATPDVDPGAETPVLAEELIEEAKATEAEVASLDFDLGTLEAPAPTAEPIAPAGEEPAADAPAVLDFDLSSAMPAEPAPAAVEPAETPASAAISALDFDLDLGAPTEAPATAALEPMELGGIDQDAPLPAAVDALAGAQADTAAPEVADDAASEVAFEFDIAAPAEEGAFDLKVDENAPLLVEEEGGDAGKTPGNDFDFDIKLTEAGDAVPATEAPGFDLGSINLDLATENPESAAEPEAFDIAAAPAAAVEEAILVAEPAVADARWEEINTKLDLAKAYEEMGDFDGARELLQEVMSEGSADLVEQAQGILVRLNA